MSSSVSRRRPSSPTITCMQDGSVVHYPDEQPVVTGIALQLLHLLEQVGIAGVQT